MKTFVIADNYGRNAIEGEPGWYFLSDSAVTNTGKPFYLPEGRGKTFASLSIAVRFGRLGKSISKEFAPRYYSEFAPALHFYLPEYERRLREMKLPTDAARNFDKSLFVGDFRPIEELSAFELIRNKERVAVFDPGQLCYGIDQLISLISVMNTIKMGDMLVPGLSRGIEPEEGDLLEIGCGDFRAFHVKVR